MNIAYAKNVLSLGGIQAAQYLLPFITVPYLTRTLRPEGYGLMTYSLSVAAFLSVLCDYGFGWTAMQAVAEHRDDFTAVRRIFVVVMGTKMLIFLACMVVYGTLLVFVPHFQRHREVYALAPLATLGGVLFPVWLFQGLERMVHLAWILVVGRACGVVGIFMLVNDAADVWLAVLLQAAAMLLSSLAALYLVRRWLGGGFALPSPGDIAHQLREAWRVFASTLAINLYTGAQTIIVGSLGGVTSAGYFGASEKCLTAAKAGFAVIGQAAMPQVAYLARHKPEEGLRFIRWLLLSLPIGLAASMSMFFFATPIVRLLFGDAFVQGVVPLFHILSPIPLILNLSTCFASLFMFNYGFQRQWSNMLVAACAISLTSLALFQFIMPVERAAAAALLLTETCIMLTSATFFIRASVKKLARP